MRFWKFEELQMNTEQDYKECIKILELIKLRASNKTDLKLVNALIQRYKNVLAKKGALH